MYIAGTGNVGIGTQSPLEKLDVNGNVRLSGGIIGGGSTFIQIIRQPLVGGAATVNCPPGYVIFGGGFQEYPSPGQNDDQEESYPITTTQWKCVDDGSSGYCFAVCGRADASQNW